MADAVGVTGSERLPEVVTMYLLFDIDYPDGHESE
jgi:hypothetical protein